MTHPDETTLGRFWIDKQGVIWEQITYTRQPTASFRRVVDPSQRLSGVVGSALLSELQILVPEDEVELRESVARGPENSHEVPGE